MDAEGKVHEVDAEGKVHKVDVEDKVDVIENNNSNSIEHTSILEYLTNPSYYSILNKNNKVNTIKATNTREDVRFYRKRIIALTKEMLKGDIPSRGIKEAHDDYVNILIKYFKIVDKTDIIQDQYSNSNSACGRGQGANATDGSDPNNFDCDDEHGEVQQMGIDISLRGLGGRAPADELMMRKPIINSTLNNYVIATTTHPETRIIPIKLSVDLSAPDLKTKGIKPKKIKKTD
jgi:hypothetical protein